MVGKKEVEIVSNNKNKELTLKKRYKIVYDKCIAKAYKMMPNKHKISKALRKARKIFERLHNIPRFDNFSDNICNFCDLLSDYFEGKYKNLPLSTIVAVLAGVLYVVLPFDVLVDYIPVLGWLDDVTVMSFIAQAEQNDIKEYLSWLGAFIENK